MAARSSRQPRLSRHSEPQKLSDVIARVIAQRGYARQLSASAFLEAWQGANVPVLASSSRPGQLRCGILEVIVKNSTVMQELTFRKKQILRQLAERLPEQEIVDLRFRIGVVD